MRAASASCKSALSCAKKNKKKIKTRISHPGPIVRDISETESKRVNFREGKMLLFPRRVSHRLPRRRVSDFHPSAARFAAPIELRFGHAAGDSKSRRFRSFRPVSDNGTHSGARIRAFSSSFPFHPSPLLHRDAPGNRVYPSRGWSRVNGTWRRRPQCVVALITS